MILPDSPSYVIIHKATKEAIFETFSKRIAETVNTDSYSIVPILEYLQSLNKH